MPLELHHVESCPSCEKVRLALAIEGLEYDSEIVEPDDRSERVRIPGQSDVPVLILDDGTVLHDSNRILEHLASRPDSNLLPPSRRAQGLTWILVDRADTTLAELCHGLKNRTTREGTPLRDDDLRILKRKLDDELAVLEGLLEGHPFLFGERPTVADLANHAYLNRLDRTGRLLIPGEHVRVGGWYSRVREAAGGSPIGHGGE